jgi:DNA-binding SARP family transcriptional activator/tetratricopeptide (TPR) repeat protein
VALQIDLAGRVEIRRDGRSAQLDGLGQLGRVALLYLVQEHGRAVTHDALGEALWDDRLPATWRSALRSTVVKVRGLFGQLGLESDEIVVTGPGTYELVLPSDTVIDVEAAAASVAAARASVRAGRAPDALLELDRAATLTARPLLPGANGLWIEQRRDQWRELGSAAMHVRAEALREVGDTGGSIEAAERLVEGDPLREEFHVCLMDAHAAAGNRARAIRTYDRCRRLMVETLGVEPSAATHAAYVALLEDPRAMLGGSNGSGTSPLPPTLERAIERSPLLVGREAAIVTLRAAWNDVTSGGRRIAVLSGDGGMGKTRLAAELAGAVGSDGVVLFGGCEPDGVVPYQPFVQALRPVLAALGADELRERVPVGLGELVRVFPELAQVLDEAEAVETRAPGDRYRLFEALASLVTSTADRASVLLVLDDLHWCDQPTSLLLRHLVRRLDAGRLLVVLSTRTVSNDLADVLDELPSDMAVDRIELDLLSLDAVRQLSAEILGPDVADLAPRLLSETSGSPFLLHELLRHLSDSDEAELATLVAGGAGGASIAADVGIPARVANVLDRQLTRLGANARRTIGVAALVGQSFDLSVLEAVLDADGDEVLDVVEATVAAGLVTEVPGSFGRFTFAHSLVRQFLSDEVSDVRSARWHGRIAAELERRLDGEDPDVLPELLWHRRAALDPDSDPEPVVECAVLAASDALGKLAYEDAVEHLLVTAAALEALGIDDPGCRTRLELALGTAYERAGDRQRSRDAYSEAFATARLVSDAPAMGRAALGIGGPWTPSGRVDHEHVDALTEAVEALRPEVDDELLATLLARLTRAARSLPDFDRRGPELAAAAMATARRSGSARVLGDALMAQRAVLHGPEFVHQRLEVADELAQLADEGGRSGQRLGAAPLRILSLLEVGEYLRADDAVDAYGELADALQRPVHRWCAASLRASVATRWGRFDHAERHAAAAHEIGLAADLTDADTVYETQMVLLRREQGRWAELETMIVELPERSGARRWSGVLAGVLVGSGRVDEGIEMLPDLGAMRRDPLWLASAVWAADALTAAGSVGRAEQLYADLLPYAGTDAVIGPGIAWLGPVDHSMGQLAACTGDVAGAERHFRRAMERTSVMGRCPAHVRSERALADLARSR